MEEEEEEEGGGGRREEEEEGGGGRWGVGSTLSLAGASAYKYIQWMNRHLHSIL